MMKNDDMPTVAILLCTYNGEQYIAEQLDSLLNQTYQNFICYIHDDGSSDNTVDIVKKYESISQGKIVLVEYINDIHNATNNFLSLIKYAFHNCDEKYYMLCDQDDVWKTKKIELSVQSIREVDAGEKPCLAYCDQVIVDCKLNLLHASTNGYLGKTTKDDAFKKIVFRNTAAGCCMIINRKLLELSAEVRNYDYIVLHDWWIMLIAAYYNNVIYIDNPLMLYRQHGNNTRGVDNNDFSIKLKKYILHFHENVCKRKVQADKCKMQMRELYSMQYESENMNSLIRFIEIINNQNRLYRIYKVFREGYVDKRNIFLTFFL